MLVGLSKKYRVGRLVLRLTNGQTAPTMVLPNKFGARSEARVDGGIESERFLDRSVNGVRWGGQNEI